MTKHLIALAAAAGLMAAPAALAQTQTPGHQYQKNGTLNGHAGASGYAPGIQMQENSSVKGTTGASGYAPGRTKSDTDLQLKGDAGVKAGGAKARGNAGAGAKVQVK